MPSPLLVVLDDSAWSRSLELALAQEAFALRRLPAPVSVRQLLTVPPGTPSPQLVILALPELDPELVRGFRRRDGGTPLLLLPEQAEEPQRVELLEAGADDVLLRSQGLRECIARCRALLRRSKRAHWLPASAPPGTVLELGPIRLDSGECRVWLQGREVALSPKEFRLLHCFLRQPGCALSREQLLDQVWGPDFHGDPKSIDVHVLWLRRKLEANPAQPQLLITVRGVGYRLDPPKLPR